MAIVRVNEWRRELRWIRKFQLATWEHVTNNWDWIQAQLQPYDKLNFEGGQVSSSLSQSFIKVRLCFRLDHLDLDMVVYHIDV